MGEIQESGNFKPRIVPPLDRGGNTVTSPDEISDTFADHYLNKMKEKEIPYNKPTESSNKSTKEYSIRRRYY